jgi:hypothetical protein
MSARPYRELALVPSVVEPAALVPFRTARIGSPCPKCLAVDYDKAWNLVRHPAVLIRGGVCMGRRVGLCRAGCREERPHFHARCRCCGSRWIMATADAGAP